MSTANSHPSPPSTAQRPSIGYNFIRARQLEGTYPGPSSLGIWVISLYRTYFGWGLVGEADWSSESTEVTAPGVELARVDQIAKRYRIPFYQRVRDSADASKLLATIPFPFADVRVGFEITQAFVDSPLGVIESPPEDLPLVGSHAVGLAWDMRERSRFAFDNSWGPHWGTFGRGSMTYEFLDRNLVEAWWSTMLPEAFPPSRAGVVWRQMEFPQILGGAFYLIEAYDADSDERIGWAFWTIRDGFFDIEELFVRPQYRRRGFGSKLINQILTTARQSGQLLRAWVSYADAAESNRSALTAILHKLGVTPQRSGVRWAAFKATSSQDSEFRFPTIRIPSRPAYSKDAASDRSNDSLRGTVLAYDDPFGPAVDPEEWDVLR